VRLRTSVRAGSALLILALALALALAPEMGRVNRVAAQTASFAGTTQTICGTLTTFTAPSLSSVLIGTTTVQVGVPGVIAIKTTTGTLTFLIAYGAITVGAESLTVGSNLCILMIFNTAGQVTKVEFANVTATPVTAPVGTTSTTPGVPLAARPYVETLAPDTFHRIGPNIAS
jgi:hypothetical protein